MRAHAIRLLVLLAGAAVAVWGAEPVIGTWKLDVEKSTFLPGPAPQSQVRTYEETPDGIKVKIVTADANGGTTTIEHPANFDGKDYPITGSGGPYAISMTKLSDYESESTLTHASKTIGKATRAVAQDGKTMTVTYKGIDRMGQQVDNIAVYNKE
jgi:hypothetical protein